MDAPHVVCPWQCVHEPGEVRRPGRSVSAKELFEGDDVVERALGLVVLRRCRGSTQQEVGELAGGAFDTSVQTVVRNAAVRDGAEVLGGGEDTRRHDHRAQVAEQRPQRMVEHERVPADPAVAAINVGLPASASLSRTSKNVLKRPEYDAVKTGVTAISASARATVSMACSRTGDGNPVTRLSASGRASGRSSTTCTSDSWPWSRSLARTASPSRSPSSFVDDGSRRPPVTTATVYVTSPPNQMNVRPAPKRLPRSRSRKGCPFPWLDRAGDPRRPPRRATRASVPRARARGGVRRTHDGARARPPSRGCRAARGRSSAAGRRGP